MAEYFDIHNHLFNKSFLAKELLYRLMKELKNHFQQVDEEKKVRGIRDVAAKISEIIRTLKRYSYAVKVFTKKDSVAIYEELNKTYKGEFILTPLTFDLTYCFAPTPDRDGKLPKEKGIKEVFESEMSEIFNKIEKESRSLSRDYNDKISPENDRLWNDYHKAKDQFMKDTAILHEQHNLIVSRQSGERGLLKLPDAFDGFEEQISQIKKLKDIPEYKNKIFPFLAVDPRRPGIVQYAKDNVGKGKLFIGVKIYCPNGYSPTDTLLFGRKGHREGLYAYCEDNGIPITAHNSDGGFATLSKSVEIDGLFHVNGQLIQLNKERLKFKNSILGKGAVYERAATLNHPLIWEKVVEKYPKLILNLAHFGGGKQLEAALDHPDKDELWSNRIIALISDRRYNVYTDISCFSEFNVLKKFASSAVFQKNKSRILYGSDYILLLLFENDFSENVTQFRKIFGADFKVIASDNPRKFLAHVL